MRLLTILLFFPLLMQGQQNPNQLFWDSVDNTNAPVITGFNGNISTGYTNRQGNQAYASFTRTTSVSMRGAACYRATLSNGPLDGWENVKSELVWNFLPAGSPLGTLGDNTSFYRPVANMRWFGASILIPSTNTDFNTITSVLFNTKCVEDDWPTSTYLAMENGRFWLFYTRVNPDFSHQANQKIDVGPVVYNQRIDWILHRNFTAADSGYINLYRNDTPVVRLTGGNWKDNGRYSKEPYMVTGLYKWAFQSWWSPVPNTNFIEAYYDDIRVFRNGATLQEVSLKSREPGSIPNQPPNITLVSSLTTTNTSIQVVATSKDPDGTIADRTWTFLSGPNTPNLTGTTVDTLIAGSLIDGTYQFRLIATDDDGAKDTAFVTVVKSSPPTSVGLIFSDGAEGTVAPLFGGNNSDVTQYFSSRAGATYNSLFKTNERARVGNNSYRIGLRDTSASGYQFVDNALVWGYFPSVTPIGLRWASFSLYTPIELQGDATPTRVGLNFILYPVVDPLPNYLAHENDSAIFYIRKYNTGGTDLGYTRVPIAPISFNNWTDWALNRDFTLSSSGFVRLYRNKTMVYEYIGPNYNPSGVRPEPYIQTGVFKPDYNNPGNNKDSVYFNYDEIKFGGPGANINTMSPNQNPVVSTSPLITDKDTGRVIGTVVDADGGIASKVWIQISGPSIADTVGTRGDTLRLQNLVNGTYSFQLIATDSLGGVGASLVAVTKEPSYNQPPIISAPDEKTYYNDASILIVIDVVDPESTALSYLWIQESGPQAKIVTANQKDLLLTNPREGIYRFTVQVTDAGGQMSSELISFIFQRYGGRVIRLPAGPVRVIPSNQ